MGSPSAVASMSLPVFLRVLADFLTTVLSSHMLELDHWPTNAIKHRLRHQCWTPIVVLNVGNVPAWLNLCGCPGHQDLKVSQPCFLCLVLNLTPTSLKLIP